MIENRRNVHGQLPPRIHDGRSYDEHQLPVSHAYAEFLSRKAVVDPMTGLADVGPHPAMMLPFQQALTTWALKRGRAAIWGDCGTGKTVMQLAWAAQVPGDVLILAPLAVAEQTAREADKFGIPDVSVARSAEAIRTRITITNYERLHLFDATKFQGVVLDESSILKSFDGTTRAILTEQFSATPFRLCCTATPAPNDYMELGNHAAFLSVMSLAEMLSMFFVHDGGETQKWRLKGHAEADFWTWLCSWAMTLRKPSDLGFDDEGFVLPALEIRQTTIQTDTPPEGYLFPVVAETLGERLAARRSTVAERAAACAAMVAAEPDEPWIIWCNLNAESQALTAAIPGAVEVTGSDESDVKAERLLAFANGDIRVLVSKPMLAGFGMNFQRCARMAFVGLSDSYEQFYQAVRRCWRFGQTRPVVAHVITADTEGAVVQNIQRKEVDAERMRASMVEHMHDLSANVLQGAAPRFKTTYRRATDEGIGWTTYLGDCVDVVAELESSSIDCTVFSPPFSSLYTYSASDRDMGNVTGDEMFFEQYAFLARELLRVTKPGRHVAFHCMNLPTSKVRDGHIGIKDFRGALIRAHEAAGWWYHSEVCIWKDPVISMQRTKAIGLLHKQLKKDSGLSRQGIPDYLVVMRKPGDNPEPVRHTNETFPVSEWQRIASPIWMDINPSDTLQYRSAREHADERHIAPLQLEVVRRALRLWSNPGDLVLSPFMGIGTEGHVALEMGRRFVGVELKESYYRQAVANLKQALQSMGELFTEPPAQEVAEQP